MTNRWEKVETVTDFIFLCSKLTLDCECIHEIKGCLLLGRKAMTNLDNILKSTGTLPSKACIVKATFFCIFFSVLVYWCELDHKEDWVPKNWCFQIVGLEKILESPLHNKQIKPVNPKRNQPWIFIGRTDAEAEAPILWPLDVNSRLTGKDLAAGNDWGQEERQTTEEKMVGWHHQLSERVFERTHGNSEGLGPWGPKESDRA